MNEMRHALFVSTLLLLPPIDLDATGVWAMETPTPVQRTNAAGKQASDVAQLRQRAEAGDRKAQYDLAEHLRAQRGRKSKREAETWFQKSSKQGYALATHMQGVMYWREEFGYANPATIGAALSLFEEAAGQGLAWSALAVADAHATGKRPWLKKDPRLACRWTLVAEGVAARGVWDAEIPKTVNAARRELPDRLMRARSSLSSTESATCEEEAAEWLRAHPLVK